MSDFVVVILLVLILVGLFFLIRPVITIIHELGHAIPAILFTRKKVTVYIGSNGNPDKSVKLTIGLLEVWFTYNPFSWREGTCIPSEEDISINQQIICVFGGPVASLIIGITAIYLGFLYDVHGFVKLILIVFLGSAVFDLIYNMVSIVTPIKVHGGGFTYNDGNSLRRLLSYWSYRKNYAFAIKLLKNEKYNDAAIAFNNLLLAGLKDEYIYRLAAYSYFRIKDYEKTKSLYNEFPENNMNANDYSMAGLVYAYDKQHETAMDYYKKSLNMDTEDVHCLNNIGYSLTELGKYDEAITQLDKAIELNKTFAYAFNNRGLAKIKTGKYEDGFKDIIHSIELDKENSYGYRNLGIYYLDTGNSKEALVHFRRAKEMDSLTLRIDDLIATAEKNIILNI